MKNGGYSLRLLAAAVLTFGGLAAIAVGLVLALAPVEPGVCDTGTLCITGPAVPSVADGVHRSTTD
jgi:hypothetical protein